MNRSMTGTNKIYIERLYLFNGFQQKPAEWSHNDIKIVFKRFGIMFVEIAVHFGGTIVGSEYITGKQHLVFNQKRQNRVGPMKVWRRKEPECFVSKVKCITILYNKRFERLINNIFKVSYSVSAPYYRCRWCQLEKNP